MKKVKESTRREPLTYHQTVEAVIVANLASYLVEDIIRDAFGGSILGVEKQPEGSFVTYKLKKKRKYLSK